MWYYKDKVLDNWFLFLIIFIASINNIIRVFYIFNYVIYNFFYIYKVVDTNSEEYK